MFFLFIRVRSFIDAKSEVYPAHIIAIIHF